MACAAPLPALVHVKARICAMFSEDYEIQGGQKTPFRGERYSDDTLVYSQLPRHTMTPSN
jgi:hypothetical protein